MLEVRGIMAGPAGIRRRLPVPPPTVETSAGPPQPARCPHCGWEVVYLAAHIREEHPEQAEQETAAEKEAREQEAARQAAVAAELAQREAEAARRKAEARARRQAIEGLPSPSPGPAQDPLPVTPFGSPNGLPHSPEAVPPPVAPAPIGPAEAEAPPRAEKGPSTRPADDVWERMRKAWAEHTVLTGTVRSRKPFGMFVDVGGIEGLVRNREMPEQRGREATSPTVQVVVIGLREDTHQIELSMRRVPSAAPPRPDRPTPGPATRPPAPEGPMALAFRLAQEKKKQAQ